MIRLLLSPALALRHPCALCAPGLVGLLGFVFLDVLQSLTLACFKQDANRNKNSIS
jgi:hypothetical protein